MAATIGRLIEVFQLGEERAGILDLPEGVRLQPGQYLPSQNLGAPPAVLPVNLFRVIGPKNQLSLGLIPDEWQPGDELACLQPQGHGFHLPGFTRRIGLLAVGISPARLLTLVPDAMVQDSEITLFCNPVPSTEVLNWVPSQVEIAPLENLQDNLNWVEFLAADIDIKDLNRLPDLLGGTHPTFSGQVLIRTAMPCRGLGACGVCSVKTHHGWRLACVDGPVFPLKELLNVV